ncbi:MAG: hypothetical protein JXQ73_27835 [Phycisphaerae bacterium]|nr:hypothetical protein [Phycisphaerae bacterium]
MTTHEAMSVPTEAVPIPPRLRWLKRIGVGTIALIVLLIVHRWLWGLYADSVLDAETARLQRLRMSAARSRFRYEAVPRENNVVLAIDQAALAMALTPDQAKLLRELAKHPDRYARRRAEIRGLFDTTTEARGLAGRIRQCSQADWSGLWEERPEALWTGYALGQDLAMLLCVSAVHQHWQGDDAGAVRSIRDALAIAAAMNTPGSGVRSIGCFHDAFVTIEMICSDLRIGRSADGDGTGSHPASPEIIQELVRHLMDEEAFRESAFEVFLRVPYGFVDNYGRWLDGSSSVLFGLIDPPRSVCDRVALGMITPMAKLDAARTLRYLVDWLGFVRQGRWPDLREWPEAEAPALLGMDQCARPFWRHREGIPPYVSWYFVVLSMRRMACLALAIRRYELDRGRRPEDLQSLVPAYLPHLPEDPFSPKGCQVRYRPDGSPAALYCIGMNRTDDGGRFCSNGTRRQCPDLPFFLDRHGNSFQRVIEWHTCFP